MKNSYNGIVVVDKPSGWTSRDVVNKLSHILGTKKVGHTGTLDPLATGVLVCTIGKCTKLTELLTSSYKTYETEFYLGEETDTLDSTGKVILTSKKVLSKEEIMDAIKSFEKQYEQEVPLYSAIKVHGKKLYEYARSKEEVVLPKRLVDIKSITNINIKDNYVKMTVEVSKGTYIRSLIRDIGRALDSYATMTNLRRVKQGDYSINDAYTIEKIEKGAFKVLNILDVLKDIPTIDADENLQKKVRNGVSVTLDLDTEYVLFTSKNEPICLYKKDADRFRMYVMF